ncbi:MAG: hypothetical protein ABIR71_06350 [Chthoniobacterales bacterium]
MKLRVDLGHASSRYQNTTFRNLQCKRIQCDEIWSLIGAKEKNCTAEMKANGFGYVWNELQSTRTTISSRAGSSGASRRLGVSLSFLWRIDFTLPAMVTGRISTPLRMCSERRSTSQCSKSMVLRQRALKCDTAPLCVWEHASAVMTGKPDHAHISASYV